MQLLHSRVFQNDVAKRDGYTPTSLMRFYRTGCRIETAVDQINSDYTPKDQDDPVRGVHVL